MAVLHSLGIVLKVIAVIIIVVIAIAVAVAFRREAAPKGRVPAGPLLRALNILRGKTVRLVFVPEHFEMSLIAAALQREFSRLFANAEMGSVDNEPDIAIFLLYTSGRLQFRLQLPNLRTKQPLELVDVQLTGRYSTLDNPQARFVAKAEGYAEQVIYSTAALIIDPTGDTKL